MWFNSLLAAVTQSWVVAMATCFSPPQLLPAAPKAEPHTVAFLSSIFIDWPSARESNLVTVETPRTALLLGFIPFDTGIRVAAVRADCTSAPGCRQKRENSIGKRGRMWITETYRQQNTQQVFFSVTFDNFLYLPHCQLLSFLDPNRQWTDLPKADISYSSVR